LKRLTVTVEPAVVPRQVANEESVIVAVMVSRSSVTLAFAILLPFE
jgi:hypothetical protein